MYYLFNRLTGQPADISNKVYANRLLAKVAVDQVHERDRGQSLRVDVVELSLIHI